MNYHRAENYVRYSTARPEGVGPLRWRGILRHFGVVVCECGHKMPVDPSLRGAEITHLPCAAKKVQAALAANPNRPVFV